MASSFQLSGLSEVGKLLAEAVYQFLFLPATLALLPFVFVPNIKFCFTLHILIDVKFMNVSI